MIIIYLLWTFLRINVISCRDLKYECPPQCRCLDNRLRADGLGQRLREVHSLLRRRDTARHYLLDVRSLESDGITMMCIGLRTLPKALPKEVSSLSVYGEEGTYFKIAINDSNNSRQDQGYSSQTASPNQLTDISRIALENSRGLKQIAFIDNNINVLYPYEFSMLNNLLTLNLRRNEIQYIAANAFYSLPLLEELRLSDNNITYLPQIFLHEVPALRSLYLDDNWLKQLHDDIFSHIPLLEILDLSNNLLRDLPENILLNNRKLRKLFLDRNEISVIRPAWFQSLDVLQMLSLAGNKIVMLDADYFTFLSNLDELRLSDNRIVHLADDTFKPLRRMRLLHLNTNAIKILPKGVFLNQFRLEYLNLHGNKITKMHNHTFGYLIKLKTLILSKNRLHTLDNDAIKHLNKLRKFNLSFNKINMITSFTFLGLHDLTELMLENNDIKYLEDSSFVVSEFSYVSKVTWINIMFNRIQHIHENTLRGLPHLKFFNIARNGLNTIHGSSLLGLHNLHTLFLHSNSIRILQPGIFRNCKHLIYLNMKENKIKSIGRESFLGLIQAVDINLQSNKILQISIEAFRHTPNLLKLDIKENFIRTFDFTTIAPMLHLNSLDLEKNTISVIRIPDYLSNNLQRVALADNNLKTLSENIKNVLGTPGSLTLAENPWKCDCKISWLRDLSGSSILTIDTSTKVICKSPKKLNGIQVQDLQASQLRCQADDNSTYANISNSVIRCPSGMFHHGSMNLADIKDAKHEVLDYHVTLFEQRRKPLCNGYLLTEWWILTSSTCVTSYITSKSKSLEKSLKVKIGFKEVHKVQKIITHPLSTSLIYNDYQFALMKLSNKSGAFLPNLTPCVISERYFISLSQTTPTVVFTARVDGRRPRAKLRTRIATLDTGKCWRDSLLCTQIRKSRKKHRLFTTGAPVYQGYSRTWGLLGIGVGNLTAGEPANRARYMPVWNVISWIEYILKSN